MLPQSVALCRAPGLQSLDRGGAIVAGVCRACLVSTNAGRLAVGDHQASPKMVSGIFTGNFLTKC